MKMRELEARTGVNRETIRVYIRHGVVPEPARPKRNVADYGEEHVQAIRSVRELQRDSALTLPQIAGVMRGSTLDRRIEPGAFQHLEQLVAARVGLDGSQVAIASLRERNPHADADAKALAELGAVEIIGSGRGARLSLTDARLVTIWGEMRAAGFVESAGFSPAILSYYVVAARFVAANEASKFFERVAGKVDEEEAAAMLQIALPRMLDFLGLLRQKAFLRFISPEGPPPVVEPLPEISAGE
jgi:DNA-binding transcriptional MerR regulator